MARLHYLSLAILLALLFVHCTHCVDLPETSPAPSPDLGADSVSPPPDVGAPASPSHSPVLSSPPAPPPSDLAPGSSPTPSPAPSPTTSSSSKKTPAPAPTVLSDISHDNEANGNGDESKESSGGLEGGQKAGIAIGVIAAVCVVGFGGMLYKKRQQNIRRSQYGYAARRELL